MSPQAAALGEVLLAVPAHKRPLARVAAFVPVEVAGVGEGARADVAAKGALARVHPCVDAHVAAAAAPVVALVALDQAPVADGVEGQPRPRVPENFQGACVSEATLHKESKTMCICLLDAVESQSWPVTTLRAKKWHNAK